MNKYVVIDANGKKHTRNSRRVYTHVVLYRDSKEAAIRLANVKPHWHKENFWYHHAFLDGTSKWLERAPYEKDDAQYKLRVEREVERSRKALMGCTTPDEWWDAIRADALAAIEKIDYTAWAAEGWCGRHDLAVKLAHKTACRERVAETIILPVEVVG